MSNVTVQSVVYQIDGQSYESRLVFNEGAKAAPGLVMAPNWMGISEDAE
ncbi:MAG TPA: dienelactone hydrolase family protein, partial [Pseudomonas sp.]|nr:dienelactone hydrolase family protein [Pseudomonas sp.]